MGRITTCGWETQILSTNANFHGEGTSAIKGGLITLGAPTIQTASPHQIASFGGAAHLRCSGANRWDEARLLGATLGRAFFARFYIRISANPGSVIQAFRFSTGTGAIVCMLRVNTGGRFQFLDSTSAVIGNNSSPLTLGAWHRVELKVLVAASPTSSNGVYETRLYDTDDSTLIWNESGSAANLGTTAIDRALVGVINANSPGGDFDYDDLAINDDTGSDQNSWPGKGVSVLLKPVADNARDTNWITSESSGNTADLFETVNNIPPLGKADTTSDSNPTKVQIRNAASTTTENYDADVESYTERGIPSGSTITLCQAIARQSIAVVSASQTGVAIKAVSNPADSAEVVNLLSFIAAVAEPSNWGTVRGNPVYAPTVTRGTRPVVRSGKRTATTRIAMVDFMAMYVDLIPIADTTPPVPSLVSESKTKISREAGADSTDIVWTSSEDFTNYMLRAVSGSGDAYTTGTLIEQDQNPSSGGTAGTEYTSTVTDDELDAMGLSGTIKVKLFTRDAAGNWST